MRTLIFLIPLFCLAVNAADTGKYKVKEATFDLIIKDNLVEKHYKNCVSLKKEGEELANCTWEALSKNEKDKNTVLEKYFKNEDTADKYQSITIANIDEKSSAAVKKLEEHMQKKLQEALYGEVNKAKSGSNKVQVVDHQIFNKLFQNQVSKNILSSVSSYCLKAKFDTESKLYLISASEDINRETQKENMNNLSKVYTKEKESKEKSIKQSNEDDKETFEGKSVAYKDWLSCFSSINKVCSLPETLSPDKEKSKAEACIITDYIKSLKQDLLASKAIQDNYDRLNKMKNNNAGFAVGNVEYFDESKDGHTIDDLTSMTSNEVRNESGYAEAVEEEKKQLEECIKNSTLAECKTKLGDTENGEALNQAITDYELRTRLMASKLETMDDDELRQHLIDEGRKDEEIQLLLANDTNREKIRAEILSNYEAEQTAIIESLRKKVGDNTLTTDSTEEDVKTKYETMRDELKYQAEDYTQLVQYTNLVSGFLNVNDGDGKRTTNIKSIERELANSAYDPKNAQDTKDDSRSIASVGDSFSELTKKLEEMVETQDAGDDGSSKPINVDDINTYILNYNSVKLPKKKDE